MLFAFVLVEQDSVRIKIFVVKSLLNVASVALWLEIAILKQSCRSFNTVDRTFSLRTKFQETLCKKEGTK